MSKKKETKKVTKKRGNPNPVGHKHSPIVNPIINSEGKMVEINGAMADKDIELANLVKKVVGDTREWVKFPRVEKTPEAVEERLNIFFGLCQVNGEYPTVEKMALAMGIHRQTLWEWEQGTHGDEIAYLIKQAKETIHSLDAYLVSTGRMHPAAYIFRAKNYFGMRDQQDIVVTPNNPLGDLEKPEDIAKRIEGSVVIPHDED